MLNSEKKISTKKSVAVKHDCKTKVTKLWHTCGALPPKKIEKIRKLEILVPVSRLKKIEL